MKYTCADIAAPARRARTYVSPAISEPKNVQAATISPHFTQGWSSDLVRFSSVTGASWCGALTIPGPFS